MKTFATSDIRNIAIVGHGHAGKTSVAEGMLFHGGVTKRLGATDAGTTVTDFGEDEHSRKHSIRLGLAHLEEGGNKLNLVDTPGFGNFLHDAKIGLSVADTALVVLDGVAGVEVQTERVWQFAAEVETPSRVIVLNKMDRENADFARAVEAVTARFGREAVAVQVPVGTEHDFKGVVDLISGKAYVSQADGSAAVELTEPPAELADTVASLRAALVEMVAESDEALMEKFLEAEDLSEEDLRAGLRAAVASGTVYPITCASATTMVGIRALAELLSDVCPPPTVRPARTDEAGETERPCDDGQPVSAQIFKSLLDPFAGQLSLVRVASGVLPADATLANVGRDHDERTAGLCILQGKEQEKVAELHAGDLGCLAKLKDAHVGDTLSDKADPIGYAPLPVPEPMMSFALEAKTQGDEDKVTSALAKLVTEDLVLRYRFDPQTKELVVSGAGEQHVSAVVERLKQRFNVEVVLHPPRVPYKETITKAVSGSYRHKKQTGGAGQFAEVHIEIKPLERGGGFEFDTARIFGGSISNNFFASIEKGIAQVLQTGPVAGHNVVDLRAEVFDGKMHPVDSKDIAFQLAGRNLMRDLIMQAKPILLEPIMRVVVNLPEDSMGDVMSDVSGRRGRVQGMDADGSRQVIKAEVPLAEMLTYEAQLKSLTGGRGDFTMEFDHYNPVPTQLQQQIVADSAKDHVHDDD